MGKRGLRITFAILFIAILGVCIWSALSPREPYYNGKSLSDWLQDYSKPGMTINGVNPIDEADQAMRNIGTNAIPTLLHVLRAKDSGLKTDLIIFLNRHPYAKIKITPAADKNFEAFLAFKALGREASNAVPELVLIYDEKISPESEYETARSIGGIGPAAKSAVPSLLCGLAATNAWVRSTSVYALGRIHGEEELVVPAALKLLHDPDPDVCGYAAYTLGEYGTSARAAIPYFIEKLNDPGTRNVFMINAFAYALNQIDPEAAAKAGVK